MKSLHNCVFRTRLMAAVGCLVFIIALVTYSTFQVKPANAAQKKTCKNITLSLQSGYIEAEEAFQGACGKCHVPPDPSKPSCSSGLSEEELSVVWNYMDTRRRMHDNGLECIEPDGREDYVTHCSKCHDTPDPVKLNCLSAPPLPDLIKAQMFMENVREGKELYSKSCTGCHEAFEPSEHDYDFWRKHLCAEAAGLDSGEAQKVLLYLKAMGKRQ